MIAINVEDIFLFLQYYQLEDITRNYSSLIPIFYQDLFTIRVINARGYGRRYSCATYRASSCGSNGPIGEVDG